MYLGIDASLDGTGLSIIANDYKIVDTAKLSTPSYGVERLYHLELKFNEFIESYSLNLACIEGGAYKESGRIYQLGQWSGIIILTLYKKGIPFVEVAPLQLKKYVSGYGKNIGKPAVMLDVYKNFGEEIRDSDIADAYVLSRIAHDTYFEAANLPLETKKYQQEVLAKIKKKDTIGKNKLI